MYPDSISLHTFYLVEGISPENSEFSSASLSGTDIALPNSKAQSAEFEATPQLMHLALSDPSIRRKRHESVMSLVMGSIPNADPQMSKDVWQEEHRPA